VNVHRPNWELTGPWRLRREPDLDAHVPSYTATAFDDGDWRAVPPSTHLQPFLYPDNPYWGQDVRAVNDAAWWYRTRWALPEEAVSRRVRLVFEGVDYYAQVWCNGHYLGEHEGDFCSFWFDVTEIAERENVLVLKVTSPWDPPRRGGLTYVDAYERRMVKGLYAHGDGLIPRDVNPIGIWRPVWLQACSDVTIEHVEHAVEEDPYDHSAHVRLRLHTRSERDEAFQGVLQVYLAGETAAGVRVDDFFSVEVSPGEAVIEQAVRIPDPHWWWPWDLGSPDLYRLRCTLFDRERRLDAHEEVFGMRRVQLIRSRDALHYHINGVPVFVRGTTYMGGLYLSQLTPQRVEEDLHKVRECGLNLIRLHVHVALPEVYEACDRLGIMIWQDLPLNWLHDPSPAFEERAVGLLRQMIGQLDHHASVITWCAHNEPTALPFLDVNLREHPDPRLFREMESLDPSRPRFICSGKQEIDWRRSGDVHAYLGGGHGGQYTDVYESRQLLVTEFGCEAPPTEETFDEHPLLARRLAHVRSRIADLHAYQAALLKYQIEWYRLTRYQPCGGYIQFMFVDLYPQVGCGALDVARRPRPAFEALKAASQPVHVMMEYTAAGPVAIWVINDLPRPLLRCLVEWEVRDGTESVVTRGSAQEDIPAQRAHRISLLRWAVDPDKQYAVHLRLLHQREVLSENLYQNPFHIQARPAHYPWDFDPLLSMRCYGGPYAQSSLQVLNTWYGRVARAILPVYDWVESMVKEHQVPSRVGKLLKRLYG
jgi:beta-mannosidase